MERIHVPVLLPEVLRELALHPNDAVVDATFGGGGHTRDILDLTAPHGIVYAFDRDPKAMAAAAAFGKRVKGFTENFANMAEVMATVVPAPSIRAVLFDFGISSLQLDDVTLGLSFQTDQPLDMRLSRTGTMTAALLVNSAPEQELVRIFFEYGEERASRRIARAIVTARRQEKIETTGRLATIICSVVPRRGRLHPATKTFQALRIVVNDELESIQRGLVAAMSLVQVGGRVVALSFHSLEDRIVKYAFKAAAVGCPCPPSTPCSCDQGRWRLVVKKPITPSRLEQRSNPRARSAKLRVIEKIV